MASSADGIERRRYLKAPRRCPPSSAAVQNLASTAKKNITPSWKHHELLAAAASHQPTAQDVDWDAYQRNKQRRLSTVVKTSSLFVERQEEEERELAFSLLTQRIVFCPEGTYSCDFCSRMISADDLMEPIVCQQCRTTVYCSKKCRSADVHRGTHTSDICNSGNVRNRVLAQKLGRVLDQCLPPDVLTALHWLQKSTWATNWVQQYLQGKGPLLLQDDDVAPPASVETATKATKLQNNRIEICYVGWMYAITRMELATLTMLAVRELVEWVQECRDSISNRPKPAVHKPLWCGDDRKKEVSEGQSPKEEEEKTAELCQCCHGQLMSAAESASLWLEEHCGDMALRAFRLDRVVTSDGQGIIVKVLHCAYGELLHLHLNKMDKVDRQSMKRLGWAHIFHLRSECADVKQLLGEIAQPGAAYHLRGSCHHFGADEEEEIKRPVSHSPSITVVGHKKGPPPPAIRGRPPPAHPNNKKKPQPTTKPATAAKKPKATTNQEDLLRALESRIAVLSRMPVTDNK